MTVLGLLEVLPLCQSRVSGSVHKAFKKNVAVPYGPLGLLDMSPIGSQSQVFWGLLSPVQLPRAGVPDKGHELLASQREAQDF